MKNQILNRLRLLVPHAWLVALLGLAMFRFFLTGDRDVIALNSPHDDFWYVHKALTGMWGDQYTEMTFVHPPIYVWWLQLLNTFGVPLRFGIDFALVAATTYASMSVQKLTGSRIASLALAAFLLLHPYTVFIFDRSLAETLLVVTITACLASGIELWTSRGTAMGGRRLIAAVVFPLMFAISFHIRKEGIALLVPLFALALLTLINRKLWWARSGSAGPRPGTLLLLSPVVATVCLGLAISSLNYFKWGTFARYDLANSGYADAVSTLSRIDAGRTPLQVSVTRKMLADGYTASSTLRELQPQMDGAVGQQWRDISGPFVAAEGEIGNGWFYWALRDAAAHSGWHSEAKTADQKYSAVAKELRAAFATGALKERTSPLPSFVDPDFRKWLPAFPTSLANVLRVSVFPKPDDVAAPKDNATPRQFGEYFRVAGRRNPPATVEIAGWIIAPPGSMAGFALGDADPDWSPVSSNPRPDVPGALAIQITSRGLAQPDRLHFRTPDARIGHVLVGDLKPGVTVTTIGEFETTLGVDVLNATEISRVADPKLELLARFAQLSGLVFGAGLLLSLTLAAFERRLDGMLVVALGALVFCASRIGMFALLDASSWNGAQARYMMPLLPLFGLSGALCLAYLMDRGKAAFLRRTGVGSG